MEDDGLNIANLDTTNNSSQNREFLNKIKPGAIAGWHKYKILSSITAAQGILESGWGRSDLATIGNNLFGVKGSYQGNTINMNTREETPTVSSTLSGNSSKQVYTVVSGDSLWRIANKNGITLDQLLQWNNLNRNSIIHPGDNLIVSSTKNNVVSSTTSHTSTASLNKQPTTKGKTYTVVSGDSLWGIANKNGITLDQLLQWNNLNRNSIIHPGDNLFVSSTKNNVVSSTTSHTPTASSNKQPTIKGKTYTVVSGDSLWGIANKNGITLDQLLQWNNLNKNSIIHPGDTLLINK